MSVTINHQQQTPPQVPDFCSLTKKELKEHLLTYGVSASKDKSKDSLLAYELKKHYITKTLPGQGKNHPGYLKYQGINYRFYNQNKHGFIFRCTRYLLPDNTWTKCKAVQTAYRELEVKPQFINCAGTLFVELTCAGTLSYPQLLPPYHTDVSQFSVLYGYVFFGAPDQGQTLDVYRSDF